MATAEYTEYTVHPRFVNPTTVLLTKDIVSKWTSTTFAPYPNETGGAAAYFKVDETSKSHPKIWFGGAPVSTVDHEEGTSTSRPGWLTKFGMNQPQTVSKTSNIVKLNAKGHAVWVFDVSVPDEALFDTGKKNEDTGEPIIKGLREHVKEVFSTYVRHIVEKQKSKPDSTKAIPKLAFIKTKDIPKDVHPFKEDFWVDKKGVSQQGEEKLRFKCKALYSSPVNAAALASPAGMRMLKHIANFRYAGVWDDEKNSLDMTASCFLDESTEFKPDPIPQWNETKFLLVPEGGTINDAYSVVLVVNPETNEPVTCCKTGRAMYRFLGPMDVTPGSWIEAIRGEGESVFYINSEFGTTFAATDVYFVQNSNVLHYDPHDVQLVKPDGTTTSMMKMAAAPSASLETARAAVKAVVDAETLRSKRPRGDDEATESDEAAMLASAEAVEREIELLTADASHEASATSTKKRGKRVTMD